MVKKQIECVVFEKKCDECKKVIVALYENAAEQQMLQHKLKHRK